MDPYRYLLAVGRVVSWRHTIALVHPDRDADFGVLAEPLPLKTGCRQGPAPADAEALARSIRSDPDLEATAPVAVGVGGVDALRMDVVAAAGASVCDDMGTPLVVSGPQLRWHGLERGDRMRLYLLDLPGGSSAPDPGHRVRCSGGQLRGGAGGGGADLGLLRVPHEVTRTMRRRWTVTARAAVQRRYGMRKIMALTVVATIAGGCGGGEQTQTAESPSPGGAQRIEVTAVDYAFEGVPKTLEAGEVTFVLTNEGKVRHELHFGRLPSGVTAEEAALGAGKSHGFRGMLGEFIVD